MRAIERRTAANSPHLIVAALTCVALLAAACGTSGETHAPGATGTSPVIPAASGTTDQLDCVRDAYPCSWSEADPAAFHRTDQLLAFSSLLLAEDVTTDELASRLGAANGVESVGHDQLSVWFRVAGAPPVFVFADPTEDGVLEAALPPIEGAPRGAVRPDPAQVLPENRFTGCPMQGDPRSDGKGGTVGTAGKPKRALILGPWRWQMNWDTEELVDYLQLGPSRYKAVVGGEVKQIMTRHDRPSAWLDTSGEAVRLEDFCGWEQYDTIILKTHGRAICEEVQCYTALSVGRFAETKEALLLYAGGAAGVSFATSRYGNLDPNLTEAERDECIKRLEEEAPSGTLAPGAVATSSPADDCLEKLPEAGHLAVTTDFFRANYAGGLKDRMIFLSACQGMKNGDLARALRGSGKTKGVILGFDRIIDTSVANKVLLQFAEFVATGVEFGQWALDELNKTADKAEANADVTGKIEGDFTAEAMADVVPLGSVATRGTDIVSLHTMPGGPELQPGGKVKIQGRPGDDVFDVLELNARIQGVGDEGPEAYDLQIWLGDQNLPLKEYAWVDGDRDGAFFAELEASALQDLAAGESISLEIRAVLPNAEGAFSLWRYEDLQVGAEGGATVTVGGQTWDFVLADGIFGCSVSEDGTEMVASGWVDGTFDPTFSAFLRPNGIGTGQRLLADNLAMLQVEDGTNGEVWMADPTDPGGFSAALAAIPGGSSQIDTLTIDGSHAWGTATFIERNAVYQAWSDHTPLPAPVPGSFDIQCVE